VVDLSLLEPLLTVLGPAPSAYDQLGVVPGRHGNRSPNNAPRNTYQTKEGRWVAISASSQNVAERVVRLVGHPEVIDEPWFSSAGGRVEHADELDDFVGTWIAARDLDDVAARFEQAGAALAPINTIADLMQDPQVHHREVITTVEDEDLGPLRMQNVMFRMLNTPGRIRFTGRGLGEDNEDVYCGELGLSRDQLKQLNQEGVI
jgi:crotonobetainyl-CoA:carnitine CoA-transferase CaiB-like acyl-CoA transferase